MNISQMCAKNLPLRGRSVGLRTLIVALLFASCAWAQNPQTAHSADALHQLNDSVEALVQRVSPSVVQILVSGYGSTEDSGQGQMSVVIGRQRVIGSGVIVDPEGYIVTNAHVVKGAEKIEVIVPPALLADKQPGDAQDAREHNYDARIIGVARQLDLAVIKIEAHKMPADR